MNNLNNRISLGIVTIISFLCLSAFLNFHEINTDYEKCVEATNNTNFDCPFASSGGDILGFETDLFGSNPLLIDIVSFPKFTSGSTVISVTGSTISANPKSVLLPTNTSAFDFNSKELVCLVSREEILFQYNDASPTTSTVNLAPLSPTAPQFLNNNLYGIAIENNGYGSGTDIDIEIVKNIHTGIVDGVTPFNFTPSTGYLFNHEQICSATNNVDEIYFVSGTSFLTFSNANSLNPIVNHIDLGPSNLFAYYGLEYKSPGIFWALRLNNTTQSLELVEIQLNLSGTSLIGITQLFDLQANLLPSPPGWILNNEFYSTTLDTCEMKYYLSTLFDINGGSRLIEIDVPNKKHVEQYNPRYLFGIEIKDLSCEPCRCGSYTDINYRPFQGAPNQNAVCGDTLIAQCDGSIPWTLNGNFSCIGIMCPSSVDLSWTLTKPSGSTLNNTTTANPGFNISIPGNEFNASGFYQLSIQTICGQDTCVCNFVIEVKCVDCCNDLDTFCSVFENEVSIIVDDPYCKATFNIGDLGDCSQFVEYVEWGDTYIDTGPFGSNTTIMHTYPGSGTYVIKWLAYGLNNSGNYCIEKEFLDTIYLNCPAIICCDDEDEFITRIQDNIDFVVKDGFRGLEITIGNIMECDSISIKTWGDPHISESDSKWGKGKKIYQTYPDSGSYEIQYLAESFSDDTTVCFEKLFSQTINIRRPHTEYETKEMSSHEKDETAGVNYWKFWDKIICKEKIGNRTSVEDSKYHIEIAALHTIYLNDPRTSRLTNGFGQAVYTEYGEEIILSPNENVAAKIESFIPAPLGMKWYGFQSNLITPTSSVIPDSSIFYLNYELMTLESEDDSKEVVFWVSDDKDDLYDELVFDGLTSESTRKTTGTIYFPVTTCCYDCAGIDDGYAQWYTRTICEDTGKRGMSTDLYQIEGAVMKSMDWLDPEVLITDTLGQVLLTENGEELNLFYSQRVTDKIEETYPALSGYEWYGFESNSILSSSSENTTFFHFDVSAVWSDLPSGTQDTIGAVWISDNKDDLYDEIVIDGLNLTSSFIIDTTTSVNNLIDNQNVLIYPVPGTDFITMELSEKHPDIKEIEIYDIRGSYLKSIQLLIKEDNVKFSISDLKSGIYFVRITNKGRPIWIEKFVKQ